MQFNLSLTSLILQMTNLMMIQLSVWNSFRRDKTVMKRMHPMHHESIKPVCHGHHHFHSQRLQCILGNFFGTVHKGFCSKPDAMICKLFSIFALAWNNDLEDQYQKVLFHLSMPAISLALLCQRILALCPLTNYQLHPSALWKNEEFFVIF